MERNYVKDMVCTECKASFNPEGLIFRCPKCNAPLEIIYNYDQLTNIIRKEVFINRINSLWRYSELLPLKDQSEVLSLNEGGTPLHKSQRLAEKFKLDFLYLKDETRNPTWSFKDRGTTVGISKAIEVGAKVVGCASTGNMGASVAAYSARGNVKCIILTPKGTPLEKIVQILIHKPIVFSVNLPYPELYKMAYGMTETHGVYLIQSDTPQRVEGQKTTAYEICEQLDWQPPDVMIVPTSSGGNISAIWKGFKEFYTLGLIDELPRMVSIQSEGCAPIVRAHREGKDTPRPWLNPHTIAHSISNPNPLFASGKRVLKLLRESKGLAIAVSDEEILGAQKLLASREGLFAEPASAASIASINRLIELEMVDKNDKIVCLITGSGLKDVKSTVKKLNRPIEIQSKGQFREILKTII